jgi:hypothetical protein
MKHLFNDISREEKQRILEMHGVKKPLINEDSTDEDFSPYCMRCNQPDISCQRGKLSPQNINMLASQLKAEISKPADISLRDITGGKFRKVIKIIENLKASGGNFHDFCAVSAEYQKSSSTDLCTDLGRLGRKESASLKGVLDMLETVPCKRQQTPIKKPVKRTTPIQKPPIQRPPISIPPRKGTGDTYFANN